MDQSPNIPMDVSPQMNTSAQLSKAENEMKMYKVGALKNISYVDEYTEPQMEYLRSR